MKGPDGRAAGSAILFLITDRDFSAFHRLGTDEIWHFHAGDPAELVRLVPDSGVCRVAILGPDVADGHVPQSVAPAGEWQAARILAHGRGAGRGWTLLGCTLAPAWDEREFVLARREELERQFPSHARTIRELTREGPMPRER